MAATKSSVVALLPSEARMSPGVRLTVRQGWVNSTGTQQMLARAEHQDRLAMAVLVFDEFERPSIGVKCADRIVAVGENQRVVEHRRRRFQADVHLDVIACRRLHRTERRRYEARNSTFLGQPISECQE